MHEKATCTWRESQGDNIYITVTAQEQATAAAAVIMTVAL